MFCLKPKDDKFFELFAESTLLVRKSAYLLKEVMQDFTNLDEKMEQISKLEAEADDINDAIIDKLNKTFITPLDREDIYSIATILDDVVDFVQGVIERLIVYRASKPSEGAVQLTCLLVECTEELVTSFEMLKNIESNKHKILDHTRKIVHLESDGDHLYRQEVGRLFVECPDPIEILKWKEILERVEDALDHCESVADLLRGVVMKYA